MSSLICVVEGKGEVQAVPILVRRICALEAPTLVLQVPPGIAVDRGRLIQDGGIEKYMQLAAGKTGGQGAVLILLDADDDCPAQLGPALLRRATAARADVNVAVVLAKREYEAWFIAAVESLAGQRGLPANLQSPADVEAIRGAKEWLRNQMPRGRTYSPTADQTALTALFDLERARNRSASFAKCYREIVRLLMVLQAASEPSPPAAEPQT
jgi:Domain of unknown function (DUF4276)